jgi:hypothetical protein
MNADTVVYPSTSKSLLLFQSSGEIGLADHVAIRICDDPTCQGIHSLNYPAVRPDDVAED